MSLLRAFYILTYASLATLTVIFALSMLSVGSASLWTNPILSGLTILYHVIILILHGSKSQSRARMPDDGIPEQYRCYPTSKIASLVFAYVLALAWAIPIGFVSGLNFPAPYDPPVTKPRVVRAELAFDVIEFGIVWTIAAISTRMRVVSDRWERQQRQLECVVLLLLSCRVPLTWHVKETDLHPRPSRSAYHLLSLARFSASDICVLGYVDGNTHTVDAESGICVVLAQPRQFDIDDRVPCCHPHPPQTGPSHTTPSAVRFSDILSLIPDVEGRQLGLRIYPRLLVGHSNPFCIVFGRVVGIQSF